MQRHLGTLAFAVVTAVCGASEAATFRFEGDAPWTFYGRFVAFDSNDDGRITGDEVLSYQAAGGNFSGSPSQWGVSIIGGAGGLDGNFFDVDYDYLGNSLSSLIFGYSYDVECQSFPGGGPIQTRTVSGSASVFGPSTTFTFISEDVFSQDFPPGSCERFNDTPFSFSYNQTVRLTLEGGSFVVPLPAGMYLLATGLALLSLAATRKRQARPPMMA